MHACIIAKMLIGSDLNSEHTYFTLLTFANLSIIRSPIPAEGLVLQESSGPMI